LYCIIIPISLLMGWRFIIIWYYRFFFLALYTLFSLVKCIAVSFTCHLIGRRTIISITWVVVIYYYDTEWAANIRIKTLYCDTILLYVYTPRAYYTCESWRASILSILYVSRHANVNKLPRSGFNSVITVIGYLNRRVNNNRYY
jgi:hypothetical protein